MNKNIKTVILLGGKGNRMGELVSKIPKPMIPINGIPILMYILDQAKKYGFTDFLFKTHYLSHIIENYFGHGEQFNIHIEYLIEKDPLGTAGGLKYLENEDYPVMILYGDVMFDINLEKLIDFHFKKKSQATLIVHESSHPEDSDVVIMDDERITKIIHKPGHAKYGNVTNAALYILNPECFSLILDSGCMDFGKELLPALVRGGFDVYGYKTDEYVKDVGTHKRLLEAERDIMEKSEGVDFSRRSDTLL